MRPEPDTKPNKNMTRFKDKCVLITGGGSGIGRIMGRLALERGARKVVVWDIDERNIAASLAAYAASKWAVIGWSDSLRIELQEARSGVHVTTVAPYYIATGMFAGVRSRLVPILDPEKTARRIVRAVERNRTFRGLPWGFHFIRLVQGLLPDKLFDALVGNAMGIYRTMDHFTGRRTPDHTSNR